MPHRIEFAVKRAFRPHGLEAFLRRVPSGGRVLDVGCGNDSPRRIKRQRPDLFYAGLDVGDYNQSGASLVLADQYVVTSSGDFARTIAGFGPQFDAVLSLHNIEHCEDPAAVMAAMMQALKPGGRLFLAFPSARSGNFPSRGGCLNFHDDPTHTHLPDADALLRQARDGGGRVGFLSRAYRPLLSAVFGLLLEPVSVIRRRVLPFRLTWALYGFETVIWIEK